MVQLSDGSSALLPSGLFTDGEMDGTQLSLEHIGNEVNAGLSNLTYVIV